MNPESKAKGALALSMFIFGTIGIFVRYIPLPSAVIALVRGVAGTLFLLLAVCIKRKPIDKAAVKNNLLLLCLSGAAIGFNWIFLFESYRYTTVAVSTLCYYLAPVFVLIASPFVLKEKLSGKKVICILVSLVGMVFVSGILSPSGMGKNDALGVVYGLAAALLYGSVILMNKKFKAIDAYDKTILQLGAASVVLLPYTLLTQTVDTAVLNFKVVLLLLLVGIVHTGITYTLYFGSLRDLKVQTAAVLSYIDPVTAILLSALLLKEPMTLLSGIGAVLILGAAFFSEFPERTKKDVDSTGN